MQWQIKLFLNKLHFTLFTMDQSDEHNVEAG
jgi:hypothetical protein